METKISQSESDREYITNFSCRISEDNVIFMYWNWPSSGAKVNGVVIFEADETDELESLIAYPERIRRIPRGGTSRSGSDNYNYKERLTEKTAMFKVFPSWTEGDVETIYYQKTGNISPLLYKRIILERRIRRDLKNIFFGFTVLRFDFKDVRKLNDLPPDSLQYCKYNKKTKESVCRYPVDIKLLQGGAYGIMVENGYDIDLQCSREYDGAVVIRDFR